MLRRLRGLVGTAVLWALAWTPVGAALGLVQWLSLPYPVGTSAWVFVREMAKAWAVWGAGSGAIFAVMLAIAERRRAKGKVSGLSRRRAALWGALAGLSLPIYITITTDFGFISVLHARSLILLGVSVAVGAGSAVGTLALAQRAPDSDLLIPPAGR